MISDRLNTTAKNRQSSDSTFNVNPFQPRGFVVQARLQESTPATKAQLWESYQQAKQLNHNSAKLLPIQAKLSIGQPGDKYEQEADSMAAQVMQMPEPGLANSNIANSVQTRSIKPIQRACTECQEEKKEESKPEEDGDQIQAKEEYGQIPELTSVQRKVNSAEDPDSRSNLESQLNGSKGGGSPLTDEVRGFMEPRFGADFSGVRVHTGSDAVQMNGQLNAQAFAHRQDIYFGPEKSPANDALTAHELTHVVQQNILQTKLINKKLDLKIPNANQLNNNYIQLEPTPAASKDSISAAIDSHDQAAISSFVPKQLGKATTEQKMAMIDILLNKGNFFEKAKVPAIWDSFGKDIETVANAHNELWVRSFKVAADHMRTSKEVRGLQKVFNLDVEDVASSYLNQNELYCKSELKRLGLTETGEVIVGPPTEEQSTHLKATQADAAKLLVNQDALRDLRNVMCGYQRTLVMPGAAGGADVKSEFLDEKVAFDPEKQPALEPKPGDGMKSWKEVKETYDNLKSLIEARISTNPSLFPLLRGSYEDTSKTAKVAQCSREDALSILGGELHGVLMNIQKTRPMLTTLASELQPIHQQLLSGAVANPAAKSRNWKTNPFFAVLGQDITEQLKPGPWWQTIGVAAAEMAAWVVAGMATGGVAIGVGMAANSAAQVALNEGKSQALSTASQTNVTASTALISDGQVKEAEAEVIVSAAFALLDTVLAVGAVRGALRKVFQFEQEAAKSAKRAAELADKAMLTAGEEAQQAAKEARQLANEAKISAEKARATANTATPEEIARAEHKALKAEENAAKAERSALDAEASAGVFGKDIKTHAEPRTVGEHKISVRGNRVVRCSPEPCAELIHSVAERSERLISELSKSTELGSRAEELGSRLRASKQRAEALAERARTELASTTDRLKAETKFLEEGAFIEKDVQAIEQQIALEIQQSKGILGSNWGNMVKQNVAERTRVTKERATVGGNLSKDLEKRLNNLENRAEKLSKDAAEFDKPKHLRKGGVSENDISLKWKELDKDIEGLEREERVRRDVRELGGKSLGESDAEMRKNLEIPSNKDGTPGKSPDIGYDMGGGTLLLSESKGADIDGALGQFASAMSGDKAKSFKNFDLRIYMNSTAFEKLINGLNEQGFRTRKVGAEWFLVGGLDKVLGFPVRIYPG